MITRHDRVRRASAPPSVIARTRCQRRAEESGGDGGDVAERQRTRSAEGLTGPRGPRRPRSRQPSAGESIVTRPRTEHPNERAQACDWSQAGGISASYRDAAGRRGQQRTIAGIAGGRRHTGTAHTPRPRGSRRGRRATPTEERLHLPDGLQRRIRHPTSTAAIARTAALAVAIPPRARVPKSARRSTAVRETASIQQIKSGPTVASTRITRAAADNSCGFHWLPEVHDPHRVVETERQDVTTSPSAASRSAREEPSSPRRTCEQAAPTSAALGRGRWSTHHIDAGHFPSVVAATLGALLSDSQAYDRARRDDACRAARRHRGRAHACGCPRTMRQGAASRSPPASPGRSRAIARRLSSRARSTFWPGARQLVRPPAIVGRQRLDPLARLEPRDRAVQRARPELLAGHRLDVLRHRVAVLRAVGERNQDQQRRLREPAEVGERVEASSSWVLAYVILRHT